MDKFIRIFFWNPVAVKKDETYFHLQVGVIFFIWK